jgi:hypothetical protein
MPNLTSVYTYFTHRLTAGSNNHEIAFKAFNTEDKAEYEKLELYCPVGESCRHVIDAAFNMLVVCDSHPDIQQHIIKAAKIAIDIIWFG